MSDGTVHIGTNKEAQIKDVHLRLSKLVDTNMEGCTPYVREKVHRLLVCNSHILPQLLQWVYLNGEPGLTSDSANFLEFY